MSDEPHDPQEAPATFADFGLDPRLEATLSALGFSEPTPIQQQAIPPLLAGRDVIGRARTGSGKTAAYGLPLLHRINAHTGPVRALILAPTRELALQVATALSDLGKRLPVEITTIYGGSPFPPQLRALERGVPIVVGTPGRVLDHIERGSLDLAHLEVLVLDEADEMLRMGFIEDVETIIATAPPDRQVALLSATMPDDIRRVAEGHLHDPVPLQLEDEGPRVDHIDQRWMRVPQRFKLEALHRLLLTGPRGATVVFARTRKGCAEVADALTRFGIAADALHGDLNQPARERVVQRLRTGATQVVIATDVAARGLDIDHIARVINLDLPDDVETYVHRIGRTARAGRHGEAITFATSAQRRRIGHFERELGVRIRKDHVPDDLAIAQHQHAELARDLGGARDAEGFTEARAFVDDLLDTDEWTAEDLAAAAIARLAAMDRLDLRPADVIEAEVSGQRGSDGPSYDDRDDDPQDDRRPPRDRGPRPQGSDEDHVEVFFSIGDRNGLRPADLVGLLANECDLPVQALGRITILHRKSFVAMPPELAEDLLSRYEAVEIRGQTVRIALNRSGPGSDGRSAPMRPPGRKLRKTGTGKSTFRGKGKGPPKGRGRG